MSNQRFGEWVTDAVVALPQDLKALRRMAEDPDVSDAGRVLIAGVILHVVSGAHGIPGMRGILAFVDDVVVVRLALLRLLESDAEPLASHIEAEPQLFGSLTGDLDTIRGYLGELTAVLDKVVDGVSAINYQGYSARQCVEDADASNWLYGAVQEAIVDLFDFDEDEVSRELRAIDQIKAPLKIRWEALP